jgi:hypothetical protein
MGLGFRGERQLEQNKSFRFNAPSRKMRKSTGRVHSRFLLGLLVMRNMSLRSVPGKSPYRSATCKAAENDCLERRNSIRPCVPSHVAYKAERGGNELFWSPWKMYPRSQERHRNREVTVYLPALGGDGPRLDRTVRIYKCSQASSAEESLKCCAALLAVSTEASGFSVMGNQHCRRREQT